MISQYNKNVDFLRFFFAVVIIIFHMYHDNLGLIYGTLDEYKELANNTSRGWIPVEFFFIISGYFLGNSSFDSMSYKEFVWKKIVRLWPIFAIATLCEAFPYFSWDTLMRLLFFQCNGFSVQFQGINWFVSSLFWTLLFYFSLIKTVNKRYIPFIISILVYFSYVYLINYGFTREVKGLFPIGVVRGIAGVGLGYLFHKFCSTIDSKTLQKKCIYLICSFGEIVLMEILIYCCLIHNIEYSNNFIFIVVFLPLMFSFIFNLGLLSKLLENNFSVILGKYSYPMYVMQQTSFYVALYVLKKINVGLEMGSIITLLICICLAIFIQKLLDFVTKKCIKTTTISSNEKTI